jgi:adenosylcobinamide-GDP ribazoletransferase
LDFFRAFSFLTILPCPSCDSPPEQLGRCCAWFPAVGLVLGTMLAAAGAGLAFILPPLPSAAFVVMLWAFLTRGLHLDGLADTFDGLGGGWDGPSRLAIMKDSRLGTFGGIALAGALMVKTALLAGLPGEAGVRALLAAPVAGRWAMLPAIYFFPSARPGGMGDLFKKGSPSSRLALGTLLAAAAAAPAGSRGAASLAAAAVLSAALSRLLTRLLGGLTGDSYGAVCELAEIGALAVFAAAPLI